MSSACADAIRDDRNDVVAAVSYLEDNPLFNCGLGSNPTLSGTIECEACFISSNRNSSSNRFGAVGAVSRLKNPCQVAKAIAMNDHCEGLVSPMILVGTGAEEWAEKKGFSLLEEDALYATNTKDIWRRARSALSEVSCNADCRMDTVGALSIYEGDVEACTSSGGLMLKNPGRLGHSAVFGSGAWAERRGERSVAVSVSGCGEAIMRADFCRSLAKQLLIRDQDELPSTVVHLFFEQSFLSPISTIESNRMYAGGLVLLEEDDTYELVVFHNTPFLPFAYRRKSLVRKNLSQLPSNSGILVESYSCR